MKEKFYKKSVHKLIEQYQVQNEGFRKPLTLKGKSSVLNPLLLLALPIGGTLLGLPSLNAQNTTNNIVDFTVEDGNAFLDIDGNGVNDFRMHGVVQSLYLAPANGNSGMVATASSSSANLVNLGYNAAISAGNIKIVSSSGVVTDAGGLGGQFNGGGPNQRGFIGVRFAISGNNHFGWIQVEIFKETGAGNNDQKVIVEAYGWNQTAGAAAQTPSAFLLPVEFAKFEASLQKETISLEWETISELNNSGFEVQRGTTEKNFKTIAFIEGKGTTTEKQAYSYDDKEIRANQKYYYRLKQIDYDGEFDFSDVVTARLKGTKQDVSDFYPNPSATGLIQTDYFATQSGNVSIEVYDVSGKKLLSDSRQISKGLNPLQFDLSSLGNGAFFVKFEQKEESVYKKLFIKK